LRLRETGSISLPKNLAIALVVEAGELAEHFQWTPDSQVANVAQSRKDELEDEVADVLIYLIRLADKLDIDPYQAVLQKLEKNDKKYPANRVKGDSRKYNQY